MNQKRNGNKAPKRVKQDQEEDQEYLSVMLGDASGYSGGSEMTRVTRTCCSLTFWAVAGTTTTSTPDGTPLVGDTVREVRKVDEWCVEELVFMFVFNHICIQTNIHYYSTSKYEYNNFTRFLSTCI